MPDTSDMELLRDYVFRSAEDAFAEVVRRQVDLVYSAALRHVNNPTQAEEISQAVFVILARKAHLLRPDTILEGWLYETTRLAALSYLRGERRRRFREQEAYMRSTLEDSGETFWNQLAPVLDDGMSRLGKKDRDAVMLRFFKQKSVREVATALNVTEAAAQRRVLRAVEKLRHFFTRRGVVLSAAALTTAISANSIQAAPASLAQTAATMAVMKGAAASSSTLTLVKGALKLMAWTQTKTAIVAGVGILLVAGATTVTVKEIQDHRTYPWETPKADFSVFYKAEPQVKIVPTKFSQSGGRSTDGGQGTLGICQPVMEIVRAAYGMDRLRTVTNAVLPADNYDFIAKLEKKRVHNSKWAEALQQEIVRKFGIRGRLEKCETDVLVLQPISSGVRNFKISHSMPNGLAFRPTPGDYLFNEQPIGTFKGVLENRFKIPIVDHTGLNDEYDYTLKWNEPDREQPNAEGFTQALREQMGLELVPGREAIQMLVVEKVP